MLSAVKSVDEMISPPRAPAADKEKARQRLNIRPTCVSTADAHRVLSEADKKRAEEETLAETRRVEAAVKKEGKKQAEDEQQLVKSTFLNLGYMQPEDRIVPVGALKKFL